MCLCNPRRAWEMPAIAPSLSRKTLSGAKPVFSQAWNLGAHPQ